MKTSELMLKGIAETEKAVKAYFIQDARGKTLATCAVGALMYGLGTGCENLGQLSKKHPEHMDSLSVYLMEHGSSPMHDNDVGMAREAIARRLAELGR